MHRSIELARATRGGITEEIHRGSVVVVQGGKTVFCIGDPSVVIPMRSTAKPFQIVPLLESGGIDRFALELNDIATMVSSHNGETVHIEQVRSLLARGGFTEVDLKCGVQPPYFTWITDQIYRESGCGPLPVHNNCSGKHVGMLLLCVLMHCEREGYWKIEHPIQQLILQTVTSCLRLTPSSIHLALDGCGVPTFCAPLEKVALAYESLGVQSQAKTESALHLVGQAMLTYPHYVAGTGRLDTEIMLLRPIIAKSGSSGVFAIAVPERSLGIAIKIESGSEEASECVAMAILEQLGILGDLELERLHQFRRIPRMTWTEAQCGYWEPIFRLELHGSSF